LKLKEEWHAGTRLMKKTGEPLQKATHSYFVSRGVGIGCAWGQVPHHVLVG